MQSKEIDEALKEALEIEDKTEKECLKIGCLYLNKHDLGQNDGSDTKAVEWLIEASQVGNEEATILLKRCLKEKIGINDDNIEEVQWCINTPNIEKRGRLSARMLFHEISAGKAVLDENEYMDRISQISNDSHEMNVLKKAIQGQVNEEYFVNRIMRILQGNNTSSFATFLKLHREADDRLTAFEQVIYYCKDLLAWLMDNVVETAADEGMVWLKALFPAHQIYMFLLLFIYSLISINTVLYFLPIISFYIFFIFVFVLTLQIFHSHRKFNRSKTISKIFKRLGNSYFSGHEDDTFYSIKPYFKFFAAVPLLIVSFELADKHWIPSSEICTMSFILVLAYWFSIKDNYGRYSHYVVLLNFLSSIPFLTEDTIYVPILYHILYAYRNFGVTINLYFDLSINIGLPSIAYLISLLVFIDMSIKSKHKFHQVLLPHLVCVFWEKFVMLFFVEATWFGLFRASCGWTLLFIISPLLLIVALFWILYQFYFYFSFFSFFKVATTFGLILGVSALPFWSNLNFFSDNLNLTQKSLRTYLILVSIFLFTSLPLAFVSFSLDDNNINYLPQDIYTRNCNDLDKVLNAQNCLHFNNLKVSWAGTVRTISIIKIENSAEDFMKWFPKFFSSWLRCTYGQRYADDCSTLQTQFEQDSCEFNKLQRIYCHLNDFSKFTYEVVVDMEDQAAKLIVSNHFSELMGLLHIGDEISFQGFLAYKEGSRTPSINLFNLQCIQCSNELPPVIKPSILSFSLIYKSAFHSVFNFFFAPFLILNEV